MSGVIGIDRAHRTTGPELDRELSVSFSSSALDF
jgi:hypothetical protein